MYQDLIERRTIKKPAVRDHDADFSGVPYVFERVCAQQHHIRDLAGFDLTKARFHPKKSRRVAGRRLKRFHGCETGLDEICELVV